MDYTLDALNEAALEIGKAVILYADAWDAVSDLALDHLGDTEGAVTFNANETIGGLRLPEHYGEGLVNAFAVGADPVLTAPLFLADPALRDIISPTNDGVIGTGTRRPVKRWTVVVMPQALYFNSATGFNNAAVRYTATDGWRKSLNPGAGTPTWTALNADEQRLLGLSIWMWSGMWERPPVTYEATVTDVVKNIEEATFRGIRPQVVGLPMVTMGDPSAHGIEIDFTP
jgi:hypothetical protein